MSTPDNTPRMLLFLQSCGKISRLPRLIRDIGVRRTIGYINLRLRLLLGFPPKQIDLFKEYGFVIQPAATPAAASVDNYQPRTINWVIPEFSLGSGGHMTIFRMIGHLEQLGYESRIVIVGAIQLTKASVARKLIRDHFVPIQASVAMGEKALRPAEFTVATEWRTAYSVRRFSRTRHKLYFIQDMEPDFFPSGSCHAFAESTYRFGFIGITVGDWLAKQVRERYGMEAYPFRLSYSKQDHQQIARRPGPRRVFFYARHVTPRRGFELGILALDLVYKALPDVEFVLVGWDVSAYLIPFPHLNAGVVPHEELADCFAQCDVALVLSLTNLSLLPVELMASGCPVVSNCGPNVEWLLQDGENALLAQATPEDLSAALIRVLSDAGLRERLIENGLSFAQSTDWAEEAKTVYGHLERIRSAS